MIRSTFAGFTTAQLALRASQKALDVTGQNIANINTDGYTRQHVDLISLNMGNGVSRYSSQYSANVGHGVLVTGISQIRDPFLDIRFRTEIAHVGEADGKLAGLQNLEGIFDEVAKNGLQNQISDLTSMFQKLSTQVGNKEFDSMVKSSAEVLAKLFNQYAKQITSVKNDQIYNLEKVDIPEVNKILKNIQELNKNITHNQIHGNQALELQDQRNMLIDELSSYAKIDVKYKPKQISDSIVVNELQIDLVGEGVNRYNLVKDNKVASFGVTDTGHDKIIVNLKDADGVNHNDVTADITTGSLKSVLDTLNCSGEFDKTANSPRGIGYYSKMLDLLAGKFASVLNDANKLSDGTAKNLFEASNGGKTISAENIRIANGWSDGTYGITASKDMHAPVGQNDNVLHMISLLSSKHDFKNGKTTIFKGTFHECFTNMGSVLGLDVKSTSSILDNYVAVTKEISNARDSSSSVSLDEEGMNLLHYQKSYNAAARLMTTLDEALNTLINNMGIVGR